MRRIRLYARFSRTEVVRSLTLVILNELVHRCPVTTLAEYRATANPAVYATNAYATPALDLEIRNPVMRHPAVADKAVVGEAGDDPRLGVSSWSMATGRMFGGFPKTNCVRFISLIGMLKNLIISKTVCLV